jgi:hypothetical protein
VADLLSSRPFIESFFLEHFCDVVNVQTVAQASAGDLCLNRGDVAVAVVIPGLRVIEHANGSDLSAVGQLNDFVAVLCFTSVSIVHYFAP